MLEASPLDDIRNTERIHAVILRGVGVNRDAIHLYTVRRSAGLNGHHFVASRASANRSMSLRVE